jgi:multicomponent K+:H+ antiporter subunit D
LETVVPRVLVVEVAPILTLIGLCFAMTVGAGAIIGYTDAASAALHDPMRYIQGVLGDFSAGGGQ